MWIRRNFFNERPKSCYNGTYTTNQVVVIIFFPKQKELLVTNNVCCGEDLKVESKIEIISSVTVDHSSDLYKMVDLLNRTLKRENLMFGLALDKENPNKAVFTIYRT